VLTAAAIVLTKGEGTDQRPLVLLGRRAGTAEYDGRSWSCTLEEQCEAGETLQEALRRGLKMELLGDYYFVDKATVRMCGPFMEHASLGLCALAIVELPYSFVQVKNLWKGIKGSRELEKIVGVPLDKDRSELISGCLRTANADPLMQLFKDASYLLKYSSDEPMAHRSEKSNEPDRFEGTSLLRLAVANFLFAPNDCRH
jgi:hypothetical protein